MMNPFQKFLWERKTELLQKEKRAIGSAQLAITMQIQVFDIILRYLSSQQTEDDMAKLQLSLDQQATPVDDIKPRQDNQELTEGLTELAKALEKAWKEELKRAEKEKDKPKDLKFTLNNLPEDVKPKSVSTKIYALRSQAKLPANILPAMRTIATEEQAEKLGLKWPGKPFEVVYMKWVKNPPPVKLVKGE